MKPAEQYHNYKRILEGLGDKHCVFSQTPEGVFKYVSPGFEKLFDRSSQEMIGKNWRSLDLTPGSFMAGEEANKRVLKEKSRQVVEITSNHQDGSQRFIEVDYAPVIENGMVVILEGIYTDITEAKKTEMILQEREKEYRTMVDGLLIGVIIHSPDTKITLCNDEACKILGLSRNQLLGIDAIDPIWTFVDKEMNPLKLKDYPVNKVIRMGKPLDSYTIGIIKPDKPEVTWTQVKAVPVFSKDGTLEKIITNFSDTTERNNAQRDLIESENKFRSIVESSPTGMYLYKLDSQNQLILSDVNPAADRITGISHRSLIGKTIEEAFPKLQGTGVSKMYQDVALGIIPEQNFEIPYMSNHINGFFQVSVFQTGKGTIAVDFIDVSDRKNAEKALISSKQKSEESEERFRKLYEDSPDPILLMKDQTLVGCNRQVLRFFGTENKEDIIGLSPVDLSAARQPNGLTASEDVNRVIAITKKEGSCRTEWICKKFDETTALLEVTLVPIVLAGEELMHITWRDITESRKAEEGIKNALKKAEEATKAKSRFLANMSHEIRTPMNGVLGVTQLFADTNPTNEQKELLSMLAQSGEQMMSVIDEILDISRIEAGKMKVSKDLLGLESLIVGLLSPLKLLSEKKGVQVFCQVSPSIPSMLIGDSLRIGQVFTNIVSNAIKFTEQGSITVDCQLLKKDPKHAVIRIQVTDTGIGIPADKLERIFDSFYQVDTSNTRKFGGTGLGLSISKRLVEIMGGQLKIESEEGKGTVGTFILKLGLAESNEQEETDQSLTHDQPMKSHILVVEDDPVSGLLAKTLIHRNGLTCDVAETGNDAIQSLKSNHYDLILMDCGLPDISGYEVTRRIRNGSAGDANKRIPIIAQTAYAMKGDQEKCLEAGMNDYATKPLDHKLIENLLNKWIASTKN